MEFTNEELYEGNSAERLDKIISVVNVVLNKYGGSTFNGVLAILNRIRADIVWDGYDSLDADCTSQNLQNVLRLLMKSKSILNEEDYSTIERVIEPLEIVITELKLGYCD